MGRKNSKKKLKEKKSGGEKILKGVLDITRSGMGFVSVPDVDADIMVRPNDFNTALHGDVVRIKVNKSFDTKKNTGCNYGSGAAKKS